MVVICSKICLFAAMFIDHVFILPDRFVVCLTHKLNQGPYSPAILKNILSLVLQIFI